MAGLRKQIVERGCPSLSASVVEEFRGGYSGTETIADLLRFEKDVQTIVDVLSRELESDYKDSEKRVQYMTDLLRYPKLRDFEVEAVKRVYRQLYGEPEEEQ